MDDLLSAVEREILTWPGVGKGPGMFDSVQFTVGRREIGHLHRDGVADLPFPRATHDELIAAGQASPHRAGSPGFVSVRLRSPADVPHVVALFRQNYDRTIAAIERRNGQRERP